MVDDGARHRHTTITKDIAIPIRREGSITSDRRSRHRGSVRSDGRSNEQAVTRRRRRYTPDFSDAESESEDSESQSKSDKEKDEKAEQRAKEQTEQKQKIKAAIQAAITAAAVEAWRTRKDPGGLMTTKKAMQVAGAALAAGGLDTLMMHGGDKHEHFAKMAEAVVGGLATSATLGGKITHKREGGAQGKMIDSFITVVSAKAMQKMSDNNPLVAMIEGNGTKQTRSKSLGPEPGRHHHRKSRH